MADWEPASSVVGLIKSDIGNAAFDVAGGNRDLYSLAELKTSSTTIAAEVCDCGAENTCTVNWRFK